MTDSIVPALLGGLLIGGAASLLLWLNGRIAGVSGILGQLLVFPAAAVRENLWRVLFLLGIILGAWIAYYSGFGSAPIGRVNFPAWLLVIAGLLVGFGTSLGKGCTSGHGVCGLGRLSLRSLVATLIFLSVAIVTTFVARHGFGIVA